MSDPRFRYIEPAAPPDEADPMGEIRRQMAALAPLLEDRSADVVVSAYAPTGAVVLLDNDSVSRQGMRWQFGTTRLPGPRYVVTASDAATLARVGLAPGPCHLTAEWIAAFHDRSKRERAEKLAAESDPPAQPRGGGDVSGEARFAARSIYVVQRGEYNDRGIFGVFSTRALADAWVAGQPGPNDFDVSVWPLDDPGAHAPDGAWVARIRYDGALYNTPYWTDGANPREIASGPLGSVERGDYVGYGETPEHARRSAEELRRAVRAGTVVTQRGESWR